VAVHIDDVLKAKVAREAVGPAERFGREPGQVLDVMRSPLREQGLQQRIGDDLGVEQLLKPVQRLLASGMLVQARHWLTSRLPSAMSVLVMRRRKLRFRLFRCKDRSFIVGSPTSLPTSWPRGEIHGGRS
jgi:hypothetical protein